MGGTATIPDDIAAPQEPLPGMDAQNFLSGQSSMPTQGTPATSSLPQQDTPAAPNLTPAQSPTMTPAQIANELEAIGTGAHHSRLANVLSAVGSLMGGSKTMHLTQDADGNVSVTHDPSTQGEKWGRVAQAALTGLAAGFQNNQGPGGFGRAVASGIQAGQQIPGQQQHAAQAEANELTQQNHSAQLFKANMALLTQKIAGATFENQIAPERWNEEQIQNFDNAKEHMNDIGAGAVVGHTKTLQDAVDLSNVRPELLAAHGGQGGDVLYPITNPSGGIDWHLIPANTAKQMYDKPFTYNQTNPDPTDPTKTVNKTITVPAFSKNNGEITLLGAQNDDHTNKVAQQVFENKVKQKELTIHSQQAGAEEYKNIAEANKAKAETTTAQNTTDNAPYDPKNPDDVLAMGLARGDELEKGVFSRMPAAKKEQLYTRASELSQNTFNLPYQPAIIAQENTFANSPKTQAYMNATKNIVGTTPGTGQLDQLMKDAKDAGIGDDPIENAALMRASQSSIAAEILPKKQLAALQRFNTSRTELMRSVTTAAGNPLVSGSDSDIKLKQIMSSLAGPALTLNTLKNQTDSVRESSIREYNSNIQQNRYLQRRYGLIPMPGGATPQSAGPTPADTAGATQPTGGGGTPQPGQFPPGATHEVKVNGKHWGYQFQDGHYEQR